MFPVYSPRVMTHKSALRNGEFLMKIPKAEGRECRRGTRVEL